MFYRRKILLALIETFGGHLKRTDLQKLLFLFCIKTNKNYYEFFPYLFGSYSVLAAQDKSVLTKYGFLKEAKDYILSTKSNFRNELKQTDSKNMNSFYREFKNLKRNSLIRYTYLNYPTYAAKSRVLNTILSSSEIDQMKFWWTQDSSERLFSIGYEGLTIDGYLKKLIDHNIKALIDVRKNPLSMKYGFSKTRFKKYIEKAGIKYIHIPELGIPSNLRQNLKTTEDYKSLFKYYKTGVLPSKTKELSDLEKYIIKFKRIALTCFEKDYHSCHRHVITNYFEVNKEFKIPITHI